MLSTQFVADAVARLLAAAPRPLLKRGVGFPEISARTTVASIPTRYGDTAATIYYPLEPPDRRPPVYLTVHGGGFVVGHPEQDDPWCRYLAANADVVVVNPDYVLAPRHRFPAAARQALTAGGPDIQLQVLHYATLDLVTATKDKSSTRGPKAVLAPWMGEVFDTAYVPDKAQRRDPLVSPAWGANGDHLDGIAPALVITAEYDRLRDAPAAYARKLDALGSLVAYHEVPGVDHGYNIMSNATDITRQMYGYITELVVRAVARDQA